MSTNDCLEKTTHGKLVVTVARRRSGGERRAISLYRVRPGHERAASSMREVAAAESHLSRHRGNYDRQSGRTRTDRGVLGPRDQVCTWWPTSTSRSPLQCPVRRGRTPGCAESVCLHFDLNTGIGLEIRYSQRRLPATVLPATRRDGAISSEVKLTSTTGTVAAYLVLNGRDDAIESDPNTLVRAGPRRHELGGLHRWGFAPSPRLLAARPGQPSNAQMAIPAAARVRCRAAGRRASAARHRLAARPQPSRTTDLRALAGRS